MASVSNSPSDSSNLLLPSDLVTQYQPRNGAGEDDDVGGMKDKSPQSIITPLIYRASGPHVYYPLEPAYRVLGKVQI